jgi:hypothetical protein
MRSFLLASAALALAACSSTTSSGSDAGADAARDAASHDTGPGDAPATDLGPDAPSADLGDDASSVDLGIDAPSVDLGDDAPSVDLGQDAPVSDLGVDGPIARDLGMGMDLGGDACGFVTTLDTSCTVDGDCAYGIHQTDCCGNTHAVGFNVSESATFPTLEAACDATYPLCGCPAHPTTTDSGEIVGDPSTVLVACVARGPRNVCLTYVSTRPPDAP